MCLNWPKVSVAGSVLCYSDRSPSLPVFTFCHRVVLDVSLHTDNVVGQIKAVIIIITKRMDSNVT